MTTAKPKTPRPPGRPPTPAAALPVDADGNVRPKIKLPPDLLGEVDKDLTAFRERTGAVLSREAFLGQLIREGLTARRKRERAERRAAKEAAA